MKLGIPKESLEGERRVALTPDVVTSLVGKDVEVVVESGAGENAGHLDPAYEEAGAKVGSAEDAWGADVVARVAVPTTDEISKLHSGQVLIGHLAPLTSGETTKALADAGVTALAMESVPRITRAQAMDALSSQANVAGYAAALLAAREAGRFFPMMTTAAGTVKPARVMVLGAGVAGLQAIATARRLGAVVAGFDVRRAAWEQIASLGGKPLELDFLEDLEDENGYARPPTEEENEKIREALADAAGKQDVIITTAQIPGRPAPKLITAEAVANMAPGSVIVDLAGESGGNCELTKAGETVTSDNGVRVISPSNLASTMATHASQLYAKNIENLLDLLLTDEGELEIDMGDEVVKGATITHDGRITNDRARSVAGVEDDAPAEPTPAEPAQASGGTASPEAAESDAAEDSEEKN
ncbi:Re/Si-specific NAD(P)(+) transhydrogenase subunit alpha [Thermoleophilia bacterium SCSIO 60948]|nr:Re/Si-specific NAD(P)(+) transhydrogenase subunit alpha [Thermoleophilia bacterium SCSIO 60948]